MASLPSCSCKAVVLECSWYLTSSVGNCAGVIERVFSEQALMTGLIETNQARDHGLRWSGLRVGDGLLECDGARLRTKRDVRPPEPFNALAITEGEIDSFGRAQVRSQAPDE